MGPAPLRRLTNNQYLNAVADVLGTDVTTLPALPAASSVGGFDNDAESQQPSELLVSRYQLVAQQCATAATADDAHLAQLLGCQTWTSSGQQDACFAGFLAGTGRSLFRRPLSSDEVDRFTVRFTQWRQQLDFAGAVQLVVEAMLQSPQFVYRPEPSDAFDSYSVASRLALLLWDSVPDNALLDAAAGSGLLTADLVRPQAERLMKDDRARRVQWDFHRQWLGLDRVSLDEHQARTPAVDPLWTTATQASALAESQHFVENVMLEDGSLKGLLGSPQAWLDSESARLYGVDAPATDWSPVMLDSTQRGGVLTRIAFLAGTSHRGATSPPIRGNSVNLDLFCRQPTPPPPGIDVTPPVMGTTAATNRMLFEQRTAPAQCAACHVELNGIGFGFEHYNAAGIWQDTEAGFAIDATGALYGTDTDGPFDGALALSARLAASREVQDCAAQKWVRYALGREPVDVEGPWVDAAKGRFAGAGGDVHELLLDIVTSPTFLTLSKDPL